MKELKKIKADHYASDYAMGLVLGVPEDYYKKMEKLEEKDIPPMIVERLEDLESIGTRLDAFYKEQEEFFMNTNLDEVIEKANKSIDDVSNDTFIPREVIDNVIYNGLGFPNTNTKDKLLDYCMYLDKMNKSEQNIPDSEIENTPVEEPNVIPSLPEMPPVVSEPVGQENINRDAEIEGLNRQLDWYEQIIDTFSKLVNLASKSN